MHYQFWHIGRIDTHTPYTLYYQFPELVMPQCTLKAHFVSLINLFLVCLIV